MRHSNLEVRDCRQVGGPVAHKGQGTTEMSFLQSRGGGVLDGSREQCWNCSG